MSHPECDKLGAKLDEWNAEQNIHKKGIVRPFLCQKVKNARNVDGGSFIPNFTRVKQRRMDTLTGVKSAEVKPVKNITLVTAKKRLNAKGEEEK